MERVTCSMGSHSVTCHPTHVNAPRLNPSQIGWYSIYLPRRDERLSWPRRLVTYRGGLPIFDISISSRDICRQILKLSKIAPNFARLLPSRIFAVLASLQRFVHALSRTSRDHVFITPKVISAHSLNFKPTVDSSVVNELLLGTPVFGGGVLVQDSHSLARVKILRL